MFLPNGTRLAILFAAVALVVFAFNRAPQTTFADSSWIEAPITGYYCQYVPGYTYGDGGGYCGTTASGIVVGTYANMAACGWGWNLGDVIEIDGYGRVICYDTGHLGRYQIDLFFYTNAQMDLSGKPEVALIRWVGAAW